MAAHPVRMILIGFFMLLVGGVILPFLMVVRVITITAINETLAWILIFGSYAMSVAGLFLGVIGFAMYARTKRPPKQ
jgi:hypothetical protein